jgi:hypothetical protein
MRPSGYESRVVVSSEYWDRTHVRGLPYRGLAHRVLGPLQLRNGDSCWFVKPLEPWTV